MADSSIAVTPGSGANVDTRTVTGGDHQQVVAIGNGVDSNVATVNANGALLIQGVQGSATALSVTTSSSNSGAISCSNYNVATVTITGTYAGINLTFEVSTDGGTTWVPIDGAQLDAAASTVGGATGVITSNASRGWDVPLGAVDAFRVRSTAYASGTGAVRIALQSLPYEPLPTARLAVGLNTNMVGGVNVAQINGVATTMGNGVSGTGVQRVTIASDSTGVIAPAIPTQSFVNNAATTNATSTKASAGTVYGIIVANASAETRYLKVYNKASAPTVGTDTPVLTFPVASGATLIVPCGELGIRLGTGIAWALLGSAGAADSATTACSAASDTKVSISYL